MGARVAVFIFGLIPFAILFSGSLVACLGFAAVWGFVCCTASTAPPQRGRRR